MSNSFKKVVACLLAVLMVMFSVPFTAFAAVDTTEYTPDIQLQFGTLFQADSETAGANWIDNYSEDYIENMKGKNATYDFALSAVSGPQLKATGTVSNDAKYTVTGLTLEAADTANVANTSGNDDYELDGISADHALKAGDAFTVTVRMDNLTKVYVASAEIGFSGNIEPLYAVTAGTGKSMTYNTGTAAQLAASFDDFDADDADSYELGTHALPEGDAQALYTGINADEIGSEIRTDEVSGEQYMYAEVVAPEGANWSPVAKTNPQCIDEDGNVTNMAGKSVMATFVFVLKEDLDASNPITFYVHDGNGKAHRKDADGTYTNLMEGHYKPVVDNGSDSAATTYSENRFVSATNQFGAEEENFGSRKMTFMGKNENVESAEPTHTHDFTGAVPAWTWADDNSSATATITCTAEGCDESEGYQISATDNEIASTVKTAGTCTTKAVNTLTAEVTLNGATVSTSKDVEGAIDANNHNYVGAYTEPTCTANGFTTYTCSRCNDSYVEYDDPATTLEHNYNTPVAIAWDGDDAVTATVTLKCATCDATTTTDATVNSVEKTAATCEGNQVMTYTASYTGIDSISKDVEVPNTKLGHQYAISEIKWDTLDTATGKVDALYVCANDASHTDTRNVSTTFEVIQNQTEELPEITRFSYSEGSFSDSKDVQTKAAAGHTTHTYTVPVSIAWDGDDAVTATVTLKCSKCEATTTTAATVNSVEKSAATCTADQVMTYTASYDGLDSISKDVTVADTAKGHDYVAQSITWDGADAVTATANFVCANDANHTDAKAATVEKTLKAAATKTTPAVYTYTASYDGFDSISKDVQEGEALGVNITIPKYDIGMITVNGEEVDGTKDNTINVPYGSEVKFAVADGKDYFAGWEINGKVISEAQEYTYGAATFDMTVTPEFVEPAANTMTVIFLDKFGNKVKEYKDIEADNYAAAIAADGIPVATSFPSSRFIGWDISDADIMALTNSATVIAQYEDIESTAKYTVTVQNATGADITATALDADSYAINGQIPYDTKVTVSDDTAAGWAIDGTTVATGTSYSFFVGADVTIVKLDAAEELPTTAVIGATLLDGTDYRYNIMATRFVPAGWTLVDYGFVYGKNLTDADLNLDNEGKTGSNADSGAVKVAHGSMTNSSNEFALNYGIKAKNAPITAKSFVVAKKGTEIKVVYSDMFVKNYN